MPHALPRLRPRPSRLCVSRVVCAVVVPCSAGAAASGSSGGEVLRAHLLQIAVRASHQNGRDTHIRQIKVFGPRQSDGKALSAGGAGAASEFAAQFCTVDFQQFSTIR